MTENATLDRWLDQRTPALAIVARGDQVRKLRQNLFLVKSQSTPDKTYVVQLQADKWACECAHHMDTGRDCIHILAVQFKQNIREALEPIATRPACDRCVVINVVADGWRHNKTGSVKRWLCKTCGHKFTGMEGFHKRRADPEKIALALDLYFRGLSLRKIADHIRQVHGLKLSPMTIYRWIIHYANLAARWMDEQGATTGQRWHMDETMVNVDGKLHYLWNVMDSDSRFLLATHISKNRSMANTRAPLKKAKAATPDRPQEVYTDGMNAYPHAVTRELGYGKHHRVPSIKARESNNRIERFHGTEKERAKVMRAFDNSKGAAHIAEGFRVHYNMVRSHQTLGKTPAEAAGMEPMDGFKWRRILDAALHTTSGKVSK
ncbi:MAG: IS6 family transposase [Euryarchaeota archaeon]|nr:IS6 family transposase [Euryarchaeota archaeon]